MAKSIKKGKFFSSLLFFSTKVDWTVYVSRLLYFIITTLGKTKKKVLDVCSIISSRKEERDTKDFVVLSILFFSR